jgi:hypothetical protein
MQSMTASAMVAIAAALLVTTVLVAACTQTDVREGSETTVPATVTGSESPLEPTTQPQPRFTPETTPIGPAPTHAQTSAQRSTYTLTVQVLDYFESTPVEGVPVEVTTADFEAVHRRIEMGYSDQDGVVVFNLAAGDYEVGVPVRQPPQSAGVGRMGVNLQTHMKVTVIVAQVPS